MNDTDINNSVILILNKQRKLIIRLLKKRLTLKKIVEILNKKGICISLPTIKYWIKNNIKSNNVIEFSKCNKKEMSSIRSKSTESPKRKLYLSNQINKLIEIEGYNIFEVDENNYKWNPLRGLRTQSTSSNFNEIVISNGFKNVLEFYNLLCRMDLENKVNKFNEWKLNDGTKLGLLRIIE